MPHRVVRPNVDRPPFAGLVIDAGQEAVVGAAVDDIRIVRVGRQVSAFAAGRRLPVALADAGAVGTMRDADGRVVLLGSVNAIREISVGGDPVKLGGRLVVVAAPAFAAVKRNLGAAVVSDDHPFRRLGRDPEIVVVAVRRTDFLVGFAAVFRAPEAHIQHVDHVFALRIGVNACVIPGALPQLALIVDAPPFFAAVVGAKHAALFCFDDRPDAIWIGRRNRDAADADGAARQSLIARDLFPSVAAVGRLPDAGAFAATFQTVRRAPHAPHAREQNARIRRVHSQIDRADLFVDKEDSFPTLSAIFAAINAALIVGSEQMPEHCRVHQVRISRVNADARDVPRVLESSRFPGLAGVGRFPYAAAVRDIAAHGHLAAANIDDVWVPRAHRHRSDRTAEKLVGYIFPVLPAVDRFPHAAASAAEVVEHGIARNTGHGRGTATPPGTDAAKFQRLVQRFVESAPGRAGRRQIEQKKHHGNQRQQTHTAGTAVPAIHL